MLVDPKKHRRGSLSVEMLLLAPVLLALVVAAVEMSLLMVAQQKLEAASANGARAAAQGGDLKAVADAVSQSLGKGRIAQAEVSAVLKDEYGQPLPAGASVEVVVTVRASEVVPDLLGYFGFSIKDTILSGRTLLRKE